MTFGRSLRSALRCCSKGSHGGEGRILDVLKRRAEAMRAEYGDHGLDSERSRALKELRNFGSDGRRILPGADNLGGWAGRYRRVFHHKAGQI